MDRNTLVATTKNDGPAQRRYDRTIKLLSYLSAAWCGLCLLLISFLVTVYAVYRLGEAGHTHMIAHMRDDPGDFVGGLLGREGPLFFSY
jgi:hypothetical protein